jgi:hypothetical protein
VSAGNAAVSQTPLLIGAPAFAYIANNRDSDAIALGQTVGGLIFAGHAGMVAAQRTRIKGFDYPILFDPALYVQGSEKDSQKLDPVGDALSVQEELEVAAYITPAPMTPYRDVVCADAKRRASDPDLHCVGGHAVLAHRRTRRLARHGRGSPQPTRPHPGVAQ